MWDGHAFSGAKIALIHGREVIAYLRDDKDTIPFPGMWDLPGGGREAGETPVECVLREVEEEFGLVIHPDRIQRLTCHAGQGVGGLDTWFCVAEITAEDIDAIRFGDEGQYWRMMAVEDFLNHDDAVPSLKLRLKAALEA
jgi:8-oxo-dGTP diphosphatase